LRLPRSGERLPVFSIAVHYQPGAAHQKEAVSTITAPCRTPEIASLPLENVFDPPLIPCWSLHAIENRTPSPNGTHKEKRQ
jgi:hypothetical protein